MTCTLGILAFALYCRSATAIMDPRTSASDGTNLAREVLVSFGNTVDSMNLMWATHAAPAAPAFVRFGQTAGGTTTPAVVSAHTVPMNGSDTRTIWLHSASLAPLAPGAEYWYEIRADGSRGGVGSRAEGTEWATGEGSSVRGVLRARDNAPTDGARVAFFGDSGNREEWSNRTVPAVRALALAGELSAVVHTGDMAYYAKDDEGRQGDRHAAELSALTNASVPIFVAPGNAEVFCYRPPDTPSWGACMLDYQSRFIMPQWRDTRSLWYSFDIGRAHFAVLDSEALLWCQATQNQSAQRAWLESDLAEARAASAAKDRPWLVVVVHRPLYSGQNDTDEQQSMRDGFGDLLERYGVDLVLHGHVHSYERMFPVSGDYDTQHNATVDAAAVRREAGRDDTYVNAAHPVYVVSGAAGNGEGVDSLDGYSAYNWSFSAFRSLDFGFNNMVVHNKTHLEISFFSVVVNTTIDRFWMVKS